jgi:glycosyltransferase involved in cell wall biosynthesis
MKFGDLVTVIVPVYNRAHLIQRSVGSLISQSYRNLEILLVDDASSDDIEAAVAALGDDRVRLIRREKNGGASAARNVGIAEAKGDLIAFHDSDDIAVFDKIEKQVRALAEMPEDYIGVYAAALFFKELEEPDWEKMRTHILPAPGSRPLSGDMSRRTVRGNAMNLPTMLIKKAAVVAAGGFDERLPNNNDWDFALRVTQEGKFHFLPEPLYLVPMAISQAVIAKRISKSQKFHTKSFVFITGKLRRRGQIGPELAQHYLTASRFLIREDRPRAARRYIRGSLGIVPMQIRGYWLYAMSSVPGVYRSIRQFRKKFS